MSKTDQHKELDVKPADGIVPPNVLAYLMEHNKSGMEAVDASDMNPPYLFIIQSGTPILDKSGNRVSNGHTGEFYHTDLDTCFKELEAIILAIGKRTYYEKDMSGNVIGSYFAYMVLGVMVGSNIPFIFKAKNTAIGAVKKLNTDQNKSKRPIWSMVTKFSIENKRKTVIDKETGKPTEASWSQPILEFVGNINDEDMLKQYQGLSDKYKKLVQDKPSEDAEIHANTDPVEELVENPFA